MNCARCGGSHVSYACTVTYTEPLPRHPTDAALDDVMKAIDTYTETKILRMADSSYALEMDEARTGLERALREWKKTR